MRADILTPKQRLGAFLTGKPLYSAGSLHICETSNKVPFENIEAMMEAARTYGSYEYEV